MKIGQLHNQYRFAGGEDQVFLTEISLLRSNGHDVEVLTSSNEDLIEVGAACQAMKTIWNREAYRRIVSWLEEAKPDVLHVHNTFPRLSPSIYYAARDCSVPVVQTLHNYRLLCPNGLFYRDGAVCEACMGKGFPIPAVIHGCYRGSRAASAAVAAMQLTHRIAGTWRRQIARYIALTEFAKRKFIEGGIPGHLITVKPNFMNRDPGPGVKNGRYAIFVGRLSEEKGIRTLLKAWSELVCQFPLKIVGKGPLSEFVSAEIVGSKNIELLGPRTRDQTIDLLRSAEFLVLPSGCYEGFPMTLVEAYACGVPVIASDHGSAASLIEPDRTGLLFRAGDHSDLARIVGGAISNEGEMHFMGREARKVYQLRYTPDKGYEALISIYRDVLREARC